MGRDELLASMPLGATQGAAIDDDDRAAEVARLEAEIPDLRRDPQAVAPLLQRLGDLQLAGGECDRAILTYRRAVNAWRATADRHELACAVYALADLQRSGGAHAEAHNDFVDAERMFSQVGDVVGSGTCWLLIGECREATNRPGGALEAYRHAAEAFQTCKGDLGLAHALFRQAALLTDQDRPAAKKLYEQARDLYVRFDRAWDPNPGIRMADPALPEDLSDLRGIDPWLLGKVCQRDRVALDTRPMPKAAVEEESEEDSATTAERQRSGILGGALLLGVVAVFAGIAFVASGRVDLPIRSGHVLASVLGGAAAGTVLLGLRMMQIGDHKVSIGSTVLAFAVVFQITRVLMGNGGAVIDPQSSSVASAGMDGSRSPGLALQLREAGDQAAARNAFDEARMAYLESLDVYRALEDRAGEASVLLALAQNEAFAGRPDAARALYEDAAKLYAQVGQSAGQALALNGIVAIDERSGDPQRVAASHARALTLLRERQDTAGELELLVRVVEFNRIHGNSAAARQAVSRMVELHEQVDDKPGLALALERSSELAAASGDRALAKAELVRANSVYQNLGDAGGVARSWSSLGDLALANGSPADARGAFEKAVAAYDGAGAAATAADARIKLATADVALGQFESAVALYLATLETCVQTKRKDCQANVYRRMGELDEKRGRADAARLSYGKSEVLLAELGTADRVEVLSQMAALESKLGNKAAGLAHVRTAATYAAGLSEPRVQAAALVATGRAAEALGQPDEARRAYETALTSYEASGDVAGQIEANAVLEAFEAQRNPARAKEYSVRLAELRGGAAPAAPPAAPDQPS